jgi:hypothetical protein
MSREELKRDVDQIFNMATTLALKDGLPLSALRDPEISRCYLSRAVAGYANLMAMHHVVNVHRLTAFHY